MGGVNQPFLYESEKLDSRFPEAPFDPKAVTRASWEPKPRKPKQNGPLISFNRHPEYVFVLPIYPHQQQQLYMDAQNPEAMHG